MGYGLKHFSLINMVECSNALRSIGGEATDMEDAAQRIAQHLHDNLIDQKTGQEAVVLSRLFMTQNYCELDESLRAFARNLLGEHKPFPEMKCLTLFGSAGLNPEWNSRHDSTGHKVIPLPSEGFVGAFPMIRQLAQQFGIDVNTVLRPDPHVVLDMAQTTYNVFHVPDALGSQYIPAQDDFVVPYGIKSVIGFGGMLPSGNLFTVILFSRIHVPRDVADLFKTLAVSARLALLLFDGRGSSEATTTEEGEGAKDLRRNAELRSLKNETAGLRELMTVQERVVHEESARREEALRELEEQMKKRVRAEKALQQYTVELERANENVKQFAYIVSHDLRVPLVNLKGFSGELHTSLDTLKQAISAAMPHLDTCQQSTVTEILETDVPEALDFINSSAERMDSLVNALLRLSRLGHQEMRFTHVVTGDLVETILKALSHQLQTAEAITCVGELPTVVADQTAMEQIFGNILANAVLYLQPGRPGKIEITGERGETATTFAIRDNGRGIAQDDLPKVFAPFRRAGAQDVKGEGMGMAYVQTLIQRHSGQIRCESEVDVGTTFTFSIPHELERKTLTEKQPDKVLVRSR